MFSTIAFHLAALAVKCATADAAETICGFVSSPLRWAARTHPAREVQDKRPWISGPPGGDGMDGFMMPHRPTNARGEVRRVGVEIEFGGVSLPDAAEAVRAAFDGELRQDYEHRYTVATALGEFEVTFDSSLLSD